MRRLLVHPCHEAWIHQLSHLPFAVDVWATRGGRAWQWNPRVRPVPANVTLVSEGAHLHPPCAYAAIVAHSLADVVTLDEVDVPRLLMLHAPLVEAPDEVDEVADVRVATRQFLQRQRALAVANSETTARSWWADTAVLRPAIDVDRIACGVGALACGLRLVSPREGRRHIQRRDLHGRAFGGLPVTVLGHDPGMSPGMADWTDVRTTVQAHRFVIHLADPAREDAYSVGLLEAMASGLPVVGTPHPESPVEHGVSGFLSDDPEQLRACAEQLLDDRDLAVEMGRAARETVKLRFAPAAFVDTFVRLVRRARDRWTEEDAA
ncbi:MAG: glycosyltransferase [Vicinamibacterales bacterium]